MLMPPLSTGSWLMSREAIEKCVRRAAEARRFADEADNASVKADFLEIERGWLLVAQSYEIDVADEWAADAISSRSSDQH
jgi:hypothetical protein